MVTPVEILHLYVKAHPCYNEDVFKGGVFRAE
jgi:hypothetical protein